MNMFMSINLKTYEINNIYSFLKTHKKIENIKSSTSFKEIELAVQNSPITHTHIHTQEPDRFPRNSTRHLSTRKS